MHNTWGEWATTVQDHTGVHYHQPWTGIWGKKQFGIKFRWMWKPTSAQMPLFPHHRNSNWGQTNKNCRISSWAIWKLIKIIILNCDVMCVECQLSSSDIRFWDVSHEIWHVHSALEWFTGNVLKTTVVPCYRASGFGSRVQRLPE